MATTRTCSRRYEAVASIRIEKCITFYIYAYAYAYAYGAVLCYILYMISSTFSLR